MSYDYTAFVIRPYDKCRVIAWQMSRNRYNCFLASLWLLPCIVIIASLHHISHNIVTIYLILANFKKYSFEMSGFALNYSFWMSKNNRNCSFGMNKRRIYTPAFGGFKKVVPLLTSMGLPVEKKLRLIWRIRYSMKGWERFAVLMPSCPMISLWNGWTPHAT